jgi:tRNA threonylcarbamoyladenosine biosynthesis protein TsaE
VLSVVTHGPGETLEFGRRLGAAAQEGTVICLSGSLGAGKTWLAKGIASAYAQLNTDEVTSPAFNLVYEYEGIASDRRVVHIDFYRLDELSATDTQLFDEYLTDPEPLILVEWGERFLPSLVGSYLQVNLVADPDDDETRLITLTSVGDNEAILRLISEMATS